MPDRSPATPDYTMGYSEEFLQLLDRRSAETHAAYLLPHLRSGARVLDFGCGPGTITVGLARAVDPGEVHGVDMEESQIAMGRSAAEAGGHANAIFHVGDVTALPFDDNSFDVAHSHAVLMHVPDTAAVLSEVKRVLKPGGIVASREMFVESSFLEPGGEDVTSAWATFSRLLAANGGHPQMGKELKNTFQQAGFSDVRVGGSFTFFGTDADVAFLHKFIMDWFYSPDVIEAATKYGIATHEQFDTWKQGLDDWREAPRGMRSIRLRRGHRRKASVLNRSGCRSSRAHATAASHCSKYRRHTTSGPSQPCVYWHNPS